MVRGPAETAVGRSAECRRAGSDISVGSLCTNSDPDAVAVVSAFRLFWTIADGRQHSPAPDRLGCPQSNSAPGPQEPPSCTRARRELDFRRLAHDTDYGHHPCERTRRKL